jgi:DNA invertase Pin-like site-specific DNA recombinase
MRAAIYARLSEVDDPENADANLVQQIALGRKYAEDRGWEVLDEFVERGRSAFHDERRKVFPKLVEDVNAGKVDVVVVRHVDRLYRDASKALAFNQFCHVVCYDQGVDTTSGDPLPFGIHSLLAEAESRTKSRRTKAWRAREREAGRSRIGGPRPWGFEADGRTPRPEEYDVIRRSILAVASGSSIRGAVKMWQDAGLKGRQGRPVAFQSVKKVLARGEEFGVDPDTSERVRAILSDPRRKNNRNGSNRKTFALTGLIYCSCGARMSGIRQTRRRVPAYRCNVFTKPGVEGPHVTIRADVDELILEAVVTSPEFENATAPDPGRFSAFDEALIRLDSREANKRADYASDLIDAKTLRTALDLIDAERQALERERAELARGPGAWSSIWNELKELEDFDWQRNTIRSMVEKVVVLPAKKAGSDELADRVEVTFQGGRTETGAALTGRLEAARRESDR